MCMYVVFVLRIRRQPRSTLFPYTTLCRSVGKELTAEVFDGVAKVDVIGTSKGKGTAGVMKRHGFRGLGAAHGTQRKHRSPGSIGGAPPPCRGLSGPRLVGRVRGAPPTTT